MNIDKLLIELKACQEARIWAAGKSWKEIFDTCHRGDWLLWLYKRTNQGDLRKFTLVKAYCANTVRYLMKDERSIRAVDTAISFGNGEATEQELDADAYAAYAASADAAYAAAADAAADVAAYAAYAAAAYAAYAAAASVRANNQKLTADICRKYLPFEIWDIKEL